MRLILVRHGEPDYKLDCLTELGHKQAEAAALRLREEGISRIYASPMGRAQETAGYTSRLLQIPVETLPFLHEIRFRPAEEGDVLPHNGNPWLNVFDRVADGKTIHVSDWQAEYPYCRSLVSKTVPYIMDSFDQWLEGFGYVREGEYYRVTAPCDKTVALFSHAGASMAVVCRLFNLSYLFACSALSPDMTGITVITLHGKEGQLAAPHFEIANDARHIANLKDRNVAPDE